MGIEPTHVKGALFMGSFYEVPMHRWWWEQWKAFL